MHQSKRISWGWKGGDWFFYLILYCPEADPFLVNTRNPKASAHHVNWTGVPQLWPAHQGERKAGGNDDTIDLPWAKRGRVTVHPSVPHPNVQAPEDCSRLHPRCPATAKTLVAEPRTFSGLWQTWWGEVVVVVVTGGVIWLLVSWSLKGDVILLLNWYHENHQCFGHANFEEMCNIWGDSWLILLSVLKETSHLESCESLYELKFGSKSNLQRCHKSAETLSLSPEWSIVFCKSLHSSVGEIFLWLIKAFSFATEHTEGTCWWWPKSCHFGCPCGQLAQEDHKGNETQLLSDRCCAKSQCLFIYNLTKGCIRYLGSWWQFLREMLFLMGLWLEFSWSRT